MALVKSELQNLGFRALYPWRHATSKNTSAASRCCGAKPWRKWKCSCRSAWPRKGWNTAW
jgi:hypothetical protein